MIATASQIRAILKGVKPNQLVEISEETISIVRKTHITRVVVNVGEVERLLELGMPQIQISRKTFASLKMIQRLSRELEARKVKALERSKAVVSLPAGVSVDTERL